MSGRGSEGKKKTKRLENDIRSTMASIESIQRSFEIGTNQHEREKKKSEKKGTVILHFQRRRCSPVLGSIITVRKPIISTYSRG